MSKHVSILLWNVWMLPWKLSDNQTVARATHIAPILQDYDIVILNEAFTHKDLLTSSTTSIMSFHTLGRRAWYSIFDSGVVIISKYPCVHCVSQHFSAVTHWDMMASKGIILCRLDIAGTEVGVYGTHMQAGDRPVDQDARRAQALQVAEFINRHSEGRKVVLGGDLNMGPTRDPSFASWCVHYSNEADARSRVTAYCALRDEAKLTDVFSTDERTRAKSEEDIMRFLVRDVEAELTYLDVPVIEGVGKRGLSDSDALVCKLRL
ncbi:hypothetical protein BZG36_04197 [Bifiguratus adelaidae]|uniref:Endonuclease/exonuclease/phosphatase domain-containing protein n=1 Tax=Bifiguratus adelaidae TaxID=1938954 RepID=A0A261XWF6_9FUNG|nr:hypothetical protein BZG36_04197 [Bifiguratus adelaidae]